MDWVPCKLFIISNKISKLLHMMSKIYAMLFIYDVWLLIRQCTSTFKLVQTSLHTMRNHPAHKIHSILCWIFLHPLMMRAKTAGEFNVLIVFKILIIRMPYKMTHHIRYAVHTNMCVLLDKRKCVTFRLWIEGSVLAPNENNAIARLIHSHTHSTHLYTSPLNAIGNSPIFFFFTRFIK